MVAMTAAVDGNLKVDESLSLLEIIGKEMEMLVAFLEHGKAPSRLSRELLNSLITVVDGDNESPQISTTGDAEPPLHEEKEDETKRMRVKPEKKTKWKIPLGGSGNKLLLLAVTVATLATVVTVPGVGKFGEYLFRRLQIQMLPYWDWPSLYDEKCLVYNPHFEPPLPSLEDCHECELVEGLEVVWSVSEKLFTDRLLAENQPFVVTDALADWPAYTDEAFSIDDIVELYNTETLQGLPACDLKSNLIGRSDDLTSLLTKITQPGTSGWFAHWENCDKPLAKALRPLYRRPYFMPSMMDFTEANWVLLSSDYRSGIYKQLPHGSEVVWLAAVRGNLQVQVLPTDLCRDHCKQLSLTLEQGHMLVVPGTLWNIEYLPGQYTDNVAFAAAGFWT